MSFTSIRYFTDTNLRIKTIKKIRNDLILDCSLGVFVISLFHFYWSRKIDIDCVSSTSYRRFIINTEVVIIIICKT